MEWTEYIILGPASGLAFTPYLLSLMSCAGQTKAVVFHLSLRSSLEMRKTQRWVEREGGWALPLLITSHQAFRSVWPCRWCNFAQGYGFVIPVLSGDCSGYKEKHMSCLCRAHDVCFLLSNAASFLSLCCSQLFSCWGFPEATNWWPWNPLPGSPLLFLGVSSSFSLCPQNSTPPCDCSHTLISSLLPALQHRPH